MNFGQVKEVLYLPASQYKGGRAFVEFVEQQAADKCVQKYLQWIGSIYDEFPVRFNTCGANLQGNLLGKKPIQITYAITAEAQREFNQKRKRSDGRPREVCSEHEKQRAAERAERESEEPTVDLMDQSNVMSSFEADKKSEKEKPEAVEELDIEDDVDLGFDMEKLLGY